MVASGINKEKLATPVLILALLIIFLIICNPIAMVGVGERGVKVTLGKVSPESYGEGIHLITPFISKIKNMDVKTQKRYTETSVYTKDIQQAKISYVINYNLQPENAHRMYREVGIAYEGIVLTPVVEVPEAAAGKKRNTKNVDMVAKLFDEIAPKYTERNGGYTRIIKVGPRKGDAAMMVVIELV